MAILSWPQCVKLLGRFQKASQVTVSLWLCFCITLTANLKASSKLLWLQVITALTKTIANSDNIPILKCTISYRRDSVQHDIMYVASREMLCVSGLVYEQLWFHCKQFLQTVDNYWIEKKTSDSIFLSKIDQSKIGEHKKYILFNHRIYPIVLYILIV